MLSALLTYFTQKHLESRLKITSVNFNDPWWTIIWKQKKRAFFVCFGLSIYYSFSTQIPLYLGYIFEQKRIDLFWILAAVWIIVFAFDYFVRITNSILQLHCIHSIYYSAHKFFLTVDPLFHSDRSSGVVLNKTQRASLAFEDILDSFTRDGILEIFASSITVVISFFAVNYTLGIITLFTVFLLVSSNFIIFKNRIPEYEHKFLEADDKLKATSVENLTQAWLIRSTFATNEAIQKLKDKAKKTMSAEAFFWKAFVDLRTTFKNIYVGSICLIGSYLFHLIDTNQITPILAATLILTYMKGTHDLTKIDKPLRLFFRAYTRIINFYNFMHHFGKRTFPVLSNKEALDEEQETKSKDGITSVIMDNIFFDYTEDARIFSGHSMHLIVNESQRPKLYGVIGPSGVGKTTLISVLGGQLKPTKGSVLINDVDIYDIDDISRRQRIVLQSQVASSMRGTLAYNLLFGLPTDQTIYHEDDLISALKRVGLWDLFKTKNGLKTFIGDGGTNLSGGQRQRLNFASLYLRAQYYKPEIVLIDEPTSSLDQVSEKAITNMILELAQDMVTIVIAHRIKTLENAVGIMDFSLLATEQEMRFYSFEELLKHSDYYNNLLHDGDDSFNE